MRSRCNSTHTSSSSSSATGYSSGSSLSSSGALSNSHEGSPFSSPEEPGMAMDYEGPGSRFGTLYYRSLLQGRGLLYADQQLMAGKGTGNWVKAYASHTFLFRRDFALAMMKLSNHRVLTASMGHIRLNCSKVGWGRVLFLLIFWGEGVEAVVLVKTTTAVCVICIVFSPATAIVSTAWSGLKCLDTMIH